MQLLTDRLIELRVVDSIADETVPTAAKKTTFIVNVVAVHQAVAEEVLCIPSVSWDLVYRMEDVLGLYAEDYDPLRPGRVLR